MVAVSLMEINGGARWLQKKDSVDDQDFKNVYRNVMAPMIWRGGASPFH
jgi:hypothetical protein